MKLLRLLRSPRELSQVETLLEIHRDVIASFKQFTKARLVLLATYSRRLGLIWAYGVAVWSYDIEEVREWADRIFLALKSVLKGTYRQAVFRELTVDEASVGPNTIYALRGDEFVAIMAFVQTLPIRNAYLSPTTHYTWVPRRPLGVMIEEPRG